MRSLPIELLLGKLLVPVRIFSSFSLVLLSLLTLICRANHDGQMIGALLPKRWVLRAGSVQGRDLESRLNIFYLQSKADSEISVQIGYAAPVKPPNLTPVIH